VRRFFWRTPLIPEIVTRTDPGSLAAVVRLYRLGVIPRYLAHIGVLIATALIPVALFWPHLSAGPCSLAILTD